MVADPRSSFRGRPKKVLGFWGKAQNFYVGFEGGPGLFMLVLKVDLAFFMWILVVDQGPVGATAPKAMYVGSP